MMYLIAWANSTLTDWAWVNGEQERDVFISDLIEDGIDPDDIHVFDADDEIR